MNVFSGLKSSQHEASRAKGRNRWKFSVYYLSYVYPAAYCRRQRQAKKERFFLFLLWSHTVQSRVNDGSSFSPSETYEGDSTNTSTTIWRVRQPVTLKPQRNFAINMITLHNWNKKDVNTSFPTLDGLLNTCRLQQGISNVLYRQIKCTEA